MSILQTPLFFLPIHYRSYSKYYQDHAKWVKPKKEDVERQRGKSFDQFSAEIKAQWEEFWFWPPWRFNDIVGYLDIGMDMGNCLTADVYLKRKHFPKSARKKSGMYSTVLQRNQFVYYCEINKITVDVHDNKSYLQALNVIISTTKRLIKQCNQSFELWLPPFNFECFNFVEAYKQSNTTLR